MLYLLFQEVKSLSLNLLLLYPKKGKVWWWKFMVIMTFVNQEINFMENFNYNKDFKVHYIHM